MSTVTPINPDCIVDALRPDVVPSIWILKSRHWTGTLTLEDKFTEFNFDSANQPSLFQTALTAQQQEELRGIMNDPALIRLRGRLTMWNIIQAILFLVIIGAYIGYSIAVESLPIWVLYGIGAALSLVSIYLVISLRQLLMELLSKLNQHSTAIRQDFQWRFVDGMEARKLHKRYQGDQKDLSGVKYILEFSVRAKVVA